MTKERAAMGQLDEMDLPEDLAENIGEIDEANHFLETNNATGILIGGKAYAFVTGNHEVDITKRKDLDLLVIKGGDMLGHDENYDLFLPTQDGAHRNINGFTLPYHLHYTGKKLRSGLYLPPPEVIYLAECEMATRRAVDRVIPDIITQRYSPLAKLYKKIPAADLIMEFPGDFSWFGKSMPPFPLQLMTRKECGGKRTYLSTTWRPENAFPHTAFPEEKDVRTPECANYSTVLPEPVLAPGDIQETGLKLIESGYLKEGVTYLQKKAPEMLDSTTVLDKLFRQDTEFPLQCGEAFCIWLKTAIERKFHVIYLLDKDFCRKYGLYSKGLPYTRTINELAGNITKNFGLRYRDFAERLSQFSFTGLAPSDLPEALKTLLKSRFLHRGILNGGSFEAKFITQSGETLCINSSQNNFVREIEESGENIEDLLFTDDYYLIVQNLEISDQDINAAVLEMVEDDDVRNHLLKIPRRFSALAERKVVKGGKPLSKLIQTVLTNYDRSGYPRDLINSLWYHCRDFIPDYSANDKYKGSDLSCLVKLCQCTSVQELKKKLLAKAPQNEKYVERINRLFCN